MTSRALFICGGYLNILLENGEDIFFLSESQFFETDFKKMSGDQREGSETLLHGTPLLFPFLSHHARPRGPPSESILQHHLMLGFIPRLLYTKAHALYTLLGCLSKSLILMNLADCLIQCNSDILTLYI